MDQPFDLEAVLNTFAGSDEASDLDRRVDELAAEKVAAYLQEAGIDPDTGEQQVTEADIEAEAERRALEILGVPPEKIAEVVGKDEKKIEKKEEPKAKTEKKEEPKADEEEVAKAAAAEFERLVKERAEGYVSEWALEQSIDEAATKVASTAVAMMSDPETSQKIAEALEAREQAEQAPETQSNEAVQNFQEWLAHRNG